MSGLISSEMLLSSVLKHEVQLLLLSVVRCTAGMQTGLKSSSLHLGTQAVKSLFLCMLRTSAALEKIAVDGYRRGMDLQASACLLQL